LKELYMLNGLITPKNYGTTHHSMNTKEFINIEWIKCTSSTYISYVLTLDEYQWEIKRIMVSE
jgi:hypothetical protein